MYMDYNVFSRMNELAPLKEDVNPTDLKPMYRSSRAQQPQYFEPRNGLPSLYSNPRYYEPYASQYFGSSIEVVNAVENPSFVPIVDRRIDPNKIFSSDIAATKTVTADQTKIKKLFEKRLMESLNEKGKVGLTEDDVLAMQALTAANNSIVSSINQQVSIKKTIADLRIKQQNQNNQAVQQDTSTSGRYGNSPMDIGRSMMDSVFESANKYASAAPVNYNAPTVDPSTIDSYLPTVNPNIDLESRDIKTKVRVYGNRDETAEYINVYNDGTLADEQPSIDIHIDKVDRDAGKAYDSMNQEYDLEIIPD